MRIIENEFNGAEDVWYYLVIKRSEFLNRNCFIKIWNEVTWVSAIYVN